MCEMLWYVDWYGKEKEMDNGQRMTVLLVVELEVRHTATTEGRLTVGGLGILKTTPGP